MLNVDALLVMMTMMMMMLNCPFILSIDFVDVKRILRTWSSVVFILYSSSLLSLRQYHQERRNEKKSHKQSPKKSIFENNQRIKYRVFLTLPWFG